MRAKDGSLKSVHLSGSVWRRRIGRVNLGEGAGVIQAKARGREGRAEKGAATERGHLADGVGRGSEGPATDVGPVHEAWRENT